MNIKIENVYGTASITFNEVKPGTLCFIEDDVVGVVTDQKHSTIDRNDCNLIGATIRDQIVPEEVGVVNLNDGCMIWESVDNYVELVEDYDITVYKRIDE